ncbi:MAG: Asp-tRNA(Asn)/Glu-tRNA(Gln) amidotransferase subunit GatC [Candidatus Omnitrophota bacterium]|nr:Asp-tRNA(Asn)/Glu-tRNA(Gln) amidotransferase subunit GatC [Candidatus Omnitrophota bacterium]
MITKKEVEYVAHLSRISLSEKELEHFTKQLEAILNYINKLKQLDLSKVMPTSHVLPLKNIYREDVLKKSLPVDEVMKIAVEKEKNHFKVPKVIE